MAEVRGFLKHLTWLALACNVCVGSRQGPTPTHVSPKLALPSTHGGGHVAFSYSHLRDVCAAGSFLVKRNMVEHARWKLPCVLRPADARQNAHRRIQFSACAATFGKIAKDVTPVDAQEYQNLALEALVSVGQCVPSEWKAGVHYTTAFNASRVIQSGQIAIWARDHGQKCFCRLRSSPQKGAGQGVGEVVMEVGRDARGGIEVKRVPASQVHVITTLAQTELQRLGSIHAYARENEDEEGVLESLRSLLDVEKKQKATDMPFQPMLSNRRVSPDTEPKSGGFTGDAGPMEGTMEGGEWGEMNGWFVDKKTNLATFDVELNRPLGFTLTDVVGRGVLVESVEPGSHAQRAGIRVGDRVEISEKGFFAKPKTSLREIVEAVARSDDRSVSIRYERYAFKEPQRQKASLQEATVDRKRLSTVTKRRKFNVDVRVPVGIKLVEVAGKGVYIQEVQREGNAAQAGLRAGDKVLSASSGLGYDAGASFDRGTTYQAATSALSTLTTMFSTAQNVNLVLERGKEGQTLIETLNAESVTSMVVDKPLTAKVKGILLDPETSQSGVDSTRVLKVNLDLLNFQARKLRSGGKLARAQEMFTLCTELDPYDGRAWLALAKMSEKEKKIDKALEYLDSGLRNTPSNSFLLQAKGVLFERSGDLAKARTLYTTALNFDAAHAPSWVSLGKLEERCRRQEKARQCYVEAVKADAKNYYALQCHAVLESRMDNVAEARRLFQDCVDVNDQNAAAWQAWGVMEAKLGNLNAAITCYSKGHLASPTNAYILQAWAVLEWKRDDYVKSNELFEKAVTLRPTDGAVYQAHAQMLMQRKLYAAARSMLKRGTEKAKEHAALWQTWGLMEQRLGDVREARRIFQQGIWDAGTSDKAFMIWQAWGLLEANQGDMETARTYLARAVEAAARPAGCYVAWALLEERESVSRARALFEQAVAAEPFNIKLWSAYELFERRNSGEGSFEAGEIYQRRVVAEIRARGYSGIREKNTENTPNAVVDDGEGDVLLKAKWTSLSRGKQRLSRNIWTTDEPTPEAL